MADIDRRLAAIRLDYRQAALSEAEAGDDPFSLFERWFGEAQHAGISEVNAMTLATADAQGQPHARIVLLKGMEQDGLVFFSNYHSHKGRQLESNPQVALLFFWKELERQVRIEGRIERVAAAYSDAYFDSRPKGSQLGALASAQSEVIDSRDELERNMNRLEQEYRSGPVRRPAHWGGYKVRPHYFEFWQGRSNRLHDRLAFEGQGDQWKKYRLAP